VNLLLMGLVFLDLRLLSRGHRWTGVGIGLAAAIKLTPAIFIGYLLLTRRWREAGVATATAATATMLAALVAPTQSLIFWTDAIWDTNRIGVLAYVSNQSLQGALSRLAPPTPGSVFWALAALGVLVIWARKARLAGEVGDDRAGFALTGVVACLISPITWVHHLVWLIPALVVLADSGRRNLRQAAAGMYVVLCSSLVWLWAVNFSGVDGFLFGNAYVWIGLSMLLLVPVTTAVPAPVPLPRLVLQTQITLPSQRRALPVEVR
jgi:alpha-1,2-mannosyltransferase